MTMRRATAETIRDGQGWYWPANSRTAHYYLKDHRTACGRGLVLLLPDDLDGFASPPSSSDCAGCRRKVDAAHAALTLTAGPKTDPGCLVITITPEGDTR